MTAKLADRRMLGLIALVAMGAAIVLAAVLMQKAGPPAATAADHLDAPGLTPPGGDVQRDITDVYAFRSPTNSANTVLVLNVNGVGSPGEAAPGPDRTFARGAPAVGNTKFVLYNLNIDNDGDAVADIVLSTRFGQPMADGVQELEVRNNGKLVIPKDLGRSTGFNEATPYVASKDGVSVFAGPRDDPFFFDLVGFLNITKALDAFGLDDDPTNNAQSFIGCSSPRSNFFLNRNVSSIVLELPSSMLTGASSKIGVWATTTSGDEQVDRMGRPAIATVFIPNNPIPPDRVADGKASKKNTYNHSEPVDDQANFRSEVVDTLSVLFSLNNQGGPIPVDDNNADDAGKISGLADFLLPDILTINTASGAGFPNGRRLADDVIDTELNLITEGLITQGDCVANDSTFLGAFPYLGSPN